MTYAQIYKLILFHIFGPGSGLQAQNGGRPGPGPAPRPALSPGPPPFGAKGQVLGLKIKNT